MTPEKIEYQDQLYAIIIRAGHSVSGIEFYTPPEASQQLGAMGHPKGKVIVPHKHRVVEKVVQRTQETLFIKKGKLRVDFYTDSKHLFHSTILSPSDVILLLTGGHGFEVLEDIQMVEVKSGPFAGEMDKERFD